MSSLFDLHGRKALVCGGAGDLGREVVKALNQAGCDVVGIDCNPEIESWSTEVAGEKHPFIAWVRADLSMRIELVEGFRRAVALLSGLDILVNCQGIQRRYPPEEFPLDVWDEVIEINLTSVFEMCQLAGQLMLKSGRGKIINFASMQSFNGGVNIPAYAASKAGVAILTKSLCNAWAKHGINVNAIAPGYFDTKMTAGVKNDPDRYQQVLSRIPVGRWGQPADLHGPLIFLASPASDYLNGVVLPVDGGMLST